MATSTLVFILGGALGAAVITSITHCALKLIPYLMKERAKVGKIHDNWETMVAEATKLSQLNSQEAGNLSTSKKQDIDSVLGKERVLVEKYEKVRSYQCIMRAFMSRAELSEDMKKMADTIVSLRREIDNELKRHAVDVETKKSRKKIMERWKNLVSKFCILNLLSATTSKGASKIADQAEEMSAAERSI